MFFSSNIITLKWDIDVAFNKIENPFLCLILCLDTYIQFYTLTKTNFWNWIVLYLI